MRIQKTVLPPTEARAEPASRAPTTSAPEASTDYVEAVDFPSFVSELIGGVFAANVDSSIQQMEAYADLVRSASKSVDEFSEDNVSSPLTAAKASVSLRTVKGDDDD